jgi:DNA modification methylase
MSNIDHSTTNIATTARKLRFVSPQQLVPSDHNARKHSRAQIKAIASSISAFGFNAPIIVTADGRILAGHGRFEAAKLLKLRRIPVISIDHLTETEATAYMLADNKLTDRSTWDDFKLATQLKELSELALDFDIEAIGFEPPEIDFRIQSLEADNEADKADEFYISVGPAVTRPGDRWLLGPHRINCGNSLDLPRFGQFFEGEKAAAVFSDPPYNVRIDGHACGKGRVKHREFAMASGEMSEAGFTEFLTRSITAVCNYTVDGGLIYCCMDWRHLHEIVTAGRAVKCDLINVCVWAKTNGGMGSFYRSRHELVFVFRSGSEQHQNNVQLGRFGRSRTNVWNYPGVNGFNRKGSTQLLSVHPTCKPIALVADAILDSTKREEIVLDPFLGSGTTLLAAEKTGRRCYGIEIDPLYVDTAIERWQRMTGHEARNENGETFSAVKAKRDSNP